MMSFRSYWRDDVFLSRVEINPFRRTTIRALDSPQVMHAAVMASFDSFDDTSDRVLWRVDKVGSATYLLVQSTRRPDFHHIIDQFGRPDTGQNWNTVEYDGFLNAISDGQTVRFRLRANPTHSVSSMGDGKRGKVLAHVTIAQQLRWLEERSGRIGLRITSSDVVQRETVKFSHGSRTITLSTATFEGTAEVTDAEALRAAMSAGVGRAKAYGCGLLTVMRG